MPNERQPFGIKIKRQKEKGIVVNENVVYIGTKKYDELENKPQINNIELIGNKSLDELGIQEEGDYPDTRVTNLEIDNLF